jgi:O-antigen/teichoic acid export membrane protein
MSRQALWRASLTLVAGSVLAQALPLLLGPWITRLYSPEAFGRFSLLWTVALNLAVVGCARYEFALPLARDEGAALRLASVCARMLLLSTGLAAVVGAAWALWAQEPLAWALPLAVFASALVQALTMWATRAQAFGVLSASRVLQHGGGALLQVLFGLAAWGVVGLWWGPVAAAALAALALAWTVRPAAGWRAVARVPADAWRGAMREHRDFPLLNTPHAFASAAQDTLALLLIAAWVGDASAGLWALALRYLKAPATLVGGAVSSALYPQLVGAATPEEGRQHVRHTVRVLLVLAVGWTGVLMVAGPLLFAWVFGEPWREAGELARALGPYLALHFVASPLGVVTMAWNGQAWALKLALVGQALFVGGLALGLSWGGLVGGGWGVSAAMLGYFGYYLLALWRWPVPPPSRPPQP